MPPKEDRPLPKYVYRGDPVSEPPAELAALLAPHRGERDALISVLAELQRHYGYLSPGHLRILARELGFPLARVYGVATFYNLFRFDPPGRYQVRICRGTACHVKQSAAILDHLRAQLGIEVDQTTPDGCFTLQTVACMGACSLAPVVVVGDETRGRMTPETAWAILEELRAASALPSGSNGQREAV
jgi:NADH:ubiquinone oxidoreductase subunit E